MRQNPIALKMYRKGLVIIQVALKLEEKRLPGASSIRQQFHNARTGASRQRIRAANLAYGFLRGKPFSSMEKGVVDNYPGNSAKRTRWSRPKWDQVYETICAFGGGKDFKKEFDEWIYLADLPSTVAPKE